jgi:hypothetical protein
MKNRNSFKWLIAGSVIAISLSQAAFAQVETKRLPDGTIIYSDGSIKRPNGEMRYPKSKDGTTRLPDGTVIYPDGRTDRGTTTRGTRQPDGSIIYPDGRVRYPDGTVRYPNSRNNKRTGWIPPGQAKKMYGSKSARDYAPGHNKSKNRNYRDNDKRDDDRDDKDWKENNKDKEWKNKSKGKNKHK